jgi:hypothetical protein
MKKRFIYFPIILLLTALFCCNGQKNTGSKNETLEGTFSSKQGVMHEISCYCYHVGFLQTVDNKYVICFDRIKLEKPPSCEKISVSGYFEKVKSSEKSGSPCPGGEQDVFFVTKFECKD